jgi:aerobic carbon-monoxide dehydrogenase large subunit
MTVPPRRATNALIGSPIERLEDLRFLTGRGQYTDDLHDDKMLYAVILRSAVAHGRIRSIDVAAARNKPGVHAVITAADIGEVPKIQMQLDPLPSLRNYLQPIIAVDKVRFVGEAIAVVVADSIALGEDALEAIVVDIEQLPAIVDRDAARRGDTLLFEETGSNFAGTLVATRGDTDAAFKNAPYTRREFLNAGRHGAVPMEPRGLMAVWDDAKQHVTVSGACKVPYKTRKALATMMDLPESSVRQLEYDVGGGFGARGEFYPEDFLIPFAAKVVGRPVKWIEDRRENLMTLSHARDAACDLEIACTRDGTILALRGEAFADIGAYVRTNGATAGRNISQIMSGPYRIPHVRMDVNLVITNKTPSGTYRGPGRFEADFCRERLFDLVAADLGIDRVEFRRRNLIAESDMPYQLATVQVLDIKAECDSGNYQTTLDRCLAEFDWEERSKNQGKLIEGRYYGTAVGCYLEGGGTGPKENAKLVIESEGSIAVYVGSSSVGQGVETVFSQIAADALEVPMERIRQVYKGSTDYLAEGFGSYSSRSIVMGGNAIVNAANSLRDQIRTAAAERLNCAVNEIGFDRGMAVGPNRAALDLKEFAGLSADGTHASTKRTYSYGAHAAYVAVDPRTGQVEVIDYVAVEDVGRIVNPLTLHGQCVGAVVQGLGGALLEHFIYDENGQFLTGSLADYLLPTATDFPSIRAVALEEKPSPINPMGFKGAGEGGIIPVGGVIANAVAAALGSLGVKLFELPLSPPRVWQLIQSARLAK